MTLQRLPLLFFASLLFSIPSPGQQNTKSGDLTGKTAQQAGTLGAQDRVDSKKKPPDPVVKEVRGRDAARGALGDRITVVVDNLEAWMEADPSANDPGKLLLILDGRILKGVYPTTLKTGNTDLQFDLIRIPDNKENKDAWTAILTKSRNGSKVELSVGLENKPRFRSSAQFQVIVFPGYWPWVIVFLSVTLGLFLWLARSSDIIRDPGPDPAPGERRFFSLGRSQMAWWFFLVLAAYIYIWMITGDRETLTSNVLGLIGISAVTGLGAAVVDSNKASAAKILPQPKSEGFLKDILMDENGVTFHRFQIAVWTVVLGWIFIYSVHKDLAMPEFNAQLLGLMGISGGTYIGFKFPEKL